MSKKFEKKFIKVENLFSSFFLSYKNWYHTKMHITLINTALVKSACAM
jgi:hypothetical protein